jgi:hypothetical protein
VHVHSGITLAVKERAEVSIRPDSSKYAGSPVCGTVQERFSAQDTAQDGAGRGGSLVERGVWFERGDLPLTRPSGATFFDKDSR